ELLFEEFRELLTSRFRNVRFLGQRIHPCSSIWPITNELANGFQEIVMERSDSGFEFTGAEKRIALYFIALASDVASAAVSGSVLLDESDTLLEEKNEELRASVKETKWREQQVHEREETIDSLEEAIKWRESQIHDLSEALKWNQNR